MSTGSRPANGDLTQERRGERLHRRRQDAVGADMGSGGRVRQQVPRRAQGDGDGRLAGRQDRRGQRRLRRLEVRRERPDDDEVEAARRSPRPAMSASAGAAGRRISSTPRRAGGGAPRPASAAPSTTCRPASARAGIDWTTAIRASAAGVNGNSRSSLRTRVIDRRASSAASAWCSPQPTTSSGGWSNPPSQRRRSSSRESRRGVVVGIDQAAPLRLREALLEPFDGGLVRRSEQQVLAGPKRPRWRRRSAPNPGPGRACPARR